MRSRIFPLSVLGVFFAVLYILNPSFLSAPRAESASTINSLSGFAWSDNIGWISFNNASDGSVYPYSVNVNTGTGDFSGSAWSDNIGWISFDRTATSNPPSAPFSTGSGNIASLDLSTGKVTGWARALAGCENTSGIPATSCSGSGAGLASGGWDGWIRLSDDNNANWANKGVSLDGATGQFSGYAWGSDVVGWIDFRPTVGGVDLVILDGVCGSAHQNTFSTAPTTNLCSSGPATTVTGTGPWYWNCSGLNGGTDAQCNAFTNVIAGSCGTADGTPSLVAPTTNLCSAGDVTTVTGTGPWNWNCNGRNGGTNVSCSAPKSNACTTPADCLSGICNLDTGICALSGGSGCGDSICSATESILACPQDCKVKVQQF